MLNNGVAHIEQSPGFFRITVPSRKNWFGLLFGTFWLFGWAFGLVMVTSQALFRSSAPAPVNLFLLFWSLAWITGGLAIIVILCWGFFGQERFTLESSEVLFEKTVFGVGLKYRLDAMELRNFRTETTNSDWFGGNRWAFWGLGAGKVLFDYGFKTYSFGLALDDAEAQHLVGLLQQKFRHGVQ